MLKYFGFFCVLLALQHGCAARDSDNSDEETLELIGMLSDLMQTEGQDSVKSVKAQKPIDTRLVTYVGHVTDNDRLSSRIGQIGGLATETNGNIVVFHRGTRRWSYDSFSFNHKFNKSKYGVIEEKCVVHIDPVTHQVIKSWGSHQFYMPHGLYIDAEQNVWVTDVALHQVLKFTHGNYERPSLVLGVAFENANDEQHFCKPTDVVVRERDGDVFVSDGYCNSRIVQFDKNGKFKRVFEDKTLPIHVAHSLALIEDQNRICVADRENQRIVCFDTETGSMYKPIVHERLTRVFAIEYDGNFKLLHAVSGGDSSATRKPLGYTFDATNGKTFGQLLSIWKPSESFSDPHDLAVSADGLTIYTGELNGEIEEFSL